MHVYPEVEGTLLAQTEGISFAARDGQIIHGYLTTPPIGEAPFPMIVHPHGGPTVRMDNHWKRRLTDRRCREITVDDLPISRGKADAFRLSK